MKVLVVVELRDGVVQGASRELLTAGRALAGPEGQVEALLLTDAGTPLPALGAADALLHASDPSFGHPTAEAITAVLADVVTTRSPDAILCSYSALGLDVASDLAARTEMPLVAYCTKLTPQGRAVDARSQIYGGKFIAETHTPLPAIFMVNPGSYAEAPDGPVAPSRVTAIAVPSVLGDAKVRFLGETLPDPSVIDLATVDRIVCVGRGIKDKDSIALAQDVAVLLDAEVAGSRPVVDSGWLPKERQVGKSGRKVKPKLYLAVGVSGAPEHIEGMGRADLIVAINADAGAPIFDVAHYGATCDLFELLPALADRLKAASA